MVQETKSRRIRLPCNNSSDSLHFRMTLARQIRPHSQLRSHNASPWECRSQKSCTWTASRCTVQGSGLVTNSIVSFCFCRAFWADKGPKPCLDCHFRNTATFWCSFTWLKDTFKIVKDNKIVLMSRPGRGRVWDTPVHPSHLHNLGCRRICRTRGCTASGCCTWTGRQSKWLEDSPFHLRCRNSRCHRRISTTEVCSVQNPRM